MKPSNLRTSTRPELGVLLRHWRDARGRSQLDLSLDTGVSQRQISFIESGRSVPNRETLMAIARALDVPLRDRNTLLLAAGYAPMFSEAAWDSVEMKSVTDALTRILRQHEPFPALVMDRYWNVLMTNEAAPLFFGCFIDMAVRKGPRNMLHLIFDPDGMRPFVANWQDVARSLFERVYRESIGRVVDEKTKDLLAALLAYPDVKNECKNPVAIGFMPVIPLGFIREDRVLNYFSMVTTVGTPQTVAAQELRIECLFPADEATEIHHAMMMDAARARASQRPGEHVD
ncbi:MULTISPECIES: helix-turn-helix domain-containing protein [unclassified Mesorhizobium]|uniref:helix-turn-helix domain-containing protein n=1 Tax=unclassified Mesorhizobium TaxID=325217 RepID=UPI00112A72B0|nr:MULTISPECIES: helix-turn-helix transcriptional regulator [unclassified Mesorhizobium]MBZ9807073.1 helix-turn-helix transcriptional regulator [Mesorhizobium sp. ESP-6-2]TPM30270.1 helix-turn-helix transcriptional regulator [Mesorhizobium sp. B2-2-2]